MRSIEIILQTLNSTDKDWILPFSLYQSRLEESSINADDCPDIDDWLSPLVYVAWSRPCFCIAGVSIIAGAVFPIEAPPAPAPIFRGSYAARALSGLARMICPGLNSHQFRSDMSRGH